MKRILASILIIAMLVAVLSGCVQNKENSDDDNKSSQMTFEEARKVARDYWKLTDGENTTEDGVKVTVFGDEKDFVEKNDIKYYHFTYRALIEGGSSSNWSTWDEIYVNAKTGECTYDMIA